MCLYQNLYGNNLYIYMYYIYFLIMINNSIIAFCIFFIVPCFLIIWYNTTFFNVTCNSISIFYEIMHNIFVFSFQCI